jgi:hypothetical protein
MPQMVFHHIAEQPVDIPARVLNRHDPARTRFRRLLPSSGLVFEFKFMNGQNGCGKIAPSFHVEIGCDRLHHRKSLIDLTVNQGFCNISVVHGRLGDGSDTDDGSPSAPGSLT